ncbi:MAG: hypothetical protein AAGN66_14315 [Acidobacteriota bacterium]
MSEGRWKKGAVSTGWRRLWVVVAVLVGTAHAAEASRLSVFEVSGTPNQFSAHASQELCFHVVTSRLDGQAGAVVTFEGPTGELGTRSVMAEPGASVCFTAPPVADAGAWRGCTPPPDTIPEAYLVSATFDEAGAGAAEREDWKGLEPDDLVWKVERRVTRKDPKPKECEENLDGEWTWTFGAGELKCRRLPMKVTLPGFEDRVSITTDGAGLEGLNMTVQGRSARERIKLVRQANVVRKGKDVARWSGFQDISGLLEQTGEIPGKYELFVTSNDRLDGRLEVENARVSDDVCSISWPFHVTR